MTQPKQKKLPSLGCAKRPNHKSPSTLLWGVVYLSFTYCFSFIVMATHMIELNMVVHGSVLCRFFTYQVLNVKVNVTLHLAHTKDVHNRSFQLNANISATFEYTVSVIGEHPIARYSFPWCAD